MTDWTRLPLEMKQLVFEKDLTIDDMRNLSSSVRERKGTNRPCHPTESSLVANAKNLPFVLAQYSRFNSEVGTKV